MIIKDTDKCTYKTVMLLITNISQSTANRYISQVREHLNKKDYQIITVLEFKTYYGL